MCQAMFWKYKNDKKNLTSWSLQYSGRGNTGNNLTNISSGTDKCCEGGSGHKWTVSLGKRTGVLGKLIWKVVSEVTSGQRYKGDEGRSYVDILEEKYMR